MGSRPLSLRHPSPLARMPARPTPDVSRSAGPVAVGEHKRLLLGELLVAQGAAVVQRRQPFELLERLARGRPAAAAGVLHRGGGALGVAVERGARLAGPYGRGSRWPPA